MNWIGNKRRCLPVSFVLGIQYGEEDHDDDEAYI
jgi:hypothetical protein